jgi:hypothetical protein
MSKLDSMLADLGAAVRRNKRKQEEADIASVREEESRIDI